VNRKKKPLYRKVNTRARGVHHFTGGDFKHSRHAKRETREQVFGSMKRKVKRGLDYSPLFKYLLSKEGEKWDEVFKEASSRLDNPDTVFHMVAVQVSEQQEFIRTGENSYTYGMFVDDDGILRIVNPDIKLEDLDVYCGCCTHTFNGVVYGREKQENWPW